MGSSLIAEEKAKMSLPNIKKTADVEEIILSLFQIV